VRSGSGSGSYASSGSYPGNGSGGSGSYTPRSATVLLLQVTVLFLQAAVLLLRVAVILQAGSRGIRLEVGVTPCRQRSQAAVGLEYLYCRAKRDMMSALCQTSPI
jgi:hypothetical protein